jgi:hypothetical protein
MLNEDGNCDRGDWAKENVGVWWGVVWHGGECGV